MRWILLPVNVVVIHAADHQRVRQRRGDRINPLARADYRCRSATGDFLQHTECNDYVVLLISAERAAHCAIFAVIVSLPVACAVATMISLKAAFGARLLVFGMLGFEYPALCHD